VLDTNVLMHDPMSLFRFEEHDIYLPMITLEELDGHKKGMSEVARNARQVSRELDALATFADKHGQHRPAQKASRWPRPATAKPAASCSSRPRCWTSSCPTACRRARPTTRSSAWCRRCARSTPGREVVLVSKDINMRVKARALGLPAEDYFNDKTLEDGDLLYTGVLPLPADFWERHGKTMESWQQGGHTFYRISGPLVPGC
jgi:PhoH-like ATPase